MFKFTASKNWVLDLVLLMLFLGLFFFFALGGHPLLVPDEARYSEIAREMLASGDFITPRLNGAIFLDKPILYYWLQALSLHCFGLSEWSFRFFPALFGIFGCIYTYIATRFLFNRNTAILSTLILATSPLYFFMMHYANMDGEVAVLITVSLLSFLVAFQSESSKQKNIFLLIAYFFSGLALLTKGLMGIAFPALIAGIWIIILNRWRVLKGIHIIWGILIIAAVAMPWFWLVQKANPDFLNYFFVNQQFTRFLSHQFNDQESIFFYFPVVIVGFFPWIILLPQTVFYNVKAIMNDKQQSASQLYLLLWPLIIFIFFSIPASKTIGYILPVIPPLCILVGKILSANLFKKSFRIFWMSSLISIILIELIILKMVPRMDLPSTKPLALTINRYIKPNDQVGSYYIYYQDLPVYTGKRITVVSPDWNDPDVPHGDNWRHQISNGMQQLEVRQWLIDDDTFWKRWHSGKTMFMLIDVKYLPHFKNKAGRDFCQLDNYQEVLLIANNETLCKSHKIESSK